MADEMFLKIDFNTAGRVLFSLFIMQAACAIVTLSLLNINVQLRRVILAL